MGGFYHLHNRLPTSQKSGIVIIVLCMPLLHSALAFASKHRGAQLWTKISSSLLVLYYKLEQPSCLALERYHHPSFHVILQYKVYIEVWPHKCLSPQKICHWFLHYEHISRLLAKFVRQTQALNYMLQLNFDCTLH